MKKAIKITITALVSAVVLCVAFLLLWVFVLCDAFNPSQPDESGAADISELNELVERSDKVDMNESEGLYYINNEIVVFTVSGADKEEIKKLFANYNAEVDESMADISTYKLIFTESKSYSKLKSIISELESSSLVESAFLNTVTTTATDSEDSEETPQAEAYYPNDEWRYNDREYEQDWNVDVPRGHNWGVEAIDAPGAWGYLDKMTTVRIGLIDTVPFSAHPDLEVKNSSVLFINDTTGEVDINTYTAPVGDHGTHVSGTMNAGFNNNEGVSGVMGGKGELYHATCYFTDKSGKVYWAFTTAYAYLQQLKTLIDQDVQVINISQHTNRLIGFAASHGNANAINHLTYNARVAEQGLANIIAYRKAAGKPDFVICVSAGNSNATVYYKDDSQQYGYRDYMTEWEKFMSTFGWHGESGGSLAQYNNFLSLMTREEVVDRLIVVGAVGIDHDRSTSERTVLKYAFFSNVGDRLDIVAPGMDVYSCIADGTYDSMDGTSMAAPHVSGVAGLVFAVNPSLSGADVKKLILSTAQGRYYYGENHSGLVNARLAVEAALDTVDESGGTTSPIGITKNNGLDLCFVVDTTGSMGDDIDNARENMSDILANLAEKSADYRVALIDYRDYPERTKDSKDYPCKVQLSFTNDNDRITQAINKLDLGYGGDDEETLFSALMQASKLDWRKNARKIIIVLGDAPPHDPEPVSDYTYLQVLTALIGADIGIDFESSDDRVTNGLTLDMISVYSIGADASDSAEDFFKKISENTGGAYVGVEDASEVGDAIIDSIKQIEIITTVDAMLDFGTELADKDIDIYSDDEYCFTVKTDSTGKFKLKGVEPDTYNWSCDGIYSGGSLLIEAGTRNAYIKKSSSYWFTPTVELYKNNTATIIWITVGYTAVCFIVPIVIMLLKKLIKGKKKPTAAVSETVTAQSNTAVNGIAYVEAVPEAVQQSAPIQQAAPVQQAAPAQLSAPVQQVAPAQVQQSTADASQSASASAQCPVCSATISANARFCKACGANLTAEKTEPAKNICPNCSTENSADDIFCAKCGTKLK